MHLNLTQTLTFTATLTFPRPGPRPGPPHSMVLANANRVLRDCDGKFPGRILRAAPSDTPSRKGPEWLQGWLSDTHPVRLQKGLAGGHSLRTGA